MKYDFSSFPDRSGTGSLKWDRYARTDVLPLWVADMDFRSAPEIVEALHERVDHQVFGYTVPYPEPVDAVLDYLRKTHGLEVSAEAIVWLPGLVPALNLAARAFCGEGGSVVTSTPVYPPFRTAPENARVPLNAAPLVRENDRWTMDFPSLEKVPEGGVFFLCNPHNPVGTCFQEEELQRLLTLCRRKRWVLCSDEIHCDLILDTDAFHIPSLALADPAEDEVISLYAPSKTYNLPGLACAFAVVPHARLRQRFKREILGIITEINCFGYAGCAAAYRCGEPWRQDLLQVLRSNRQLVYEFLERHQPLVTVYPMEATYLAWFDCRQMPVSNPAAFFEDHGVGLSDGTPFGAPGWLRLNFGCPEGPLREALGRMDGALSALKCASPQG